MGRVIIYVAGMWQGHYEDFKATGLPEATGMKVINCMKTMPHDPASKFDEKGLVDSVAGQSGFVETVQQVVRTCDEQGRALVCCKAGKHRSPVVAAAAREKLIQLGHTVIVFELNMIQREFIVVFTAMCEDWVTMKRLTLEMPSHYSNLHLEDLATEAAAIENIKRAIYGPSWEEGSSWEEEPQPKKRFRPDDQWQAASASSSWQASPPLPPTETWRSGYWHEDDRTQGYSPKDIVLIDSLKLDDQAKAALMAIDVREGLKILNKFRAKTDIRNPNAFVMTAAANATAKLAAKG